jgi:eukaryotic-like serine/threonine-protein kinase
VERYLVPAIRAAVKSEQHNPAAAVDLLRETTQYKLGIHDAFDHLYPAYIRGMACLESGDGRSAAGGFQKLIDNPGLCWGYITGPLARLQLGRAQRLMGDNASARKSYEEFLKILEGCRPRYSRLSASEVRIRRAAKQPESNGLKCLEVARQNPLFRGTAYQRI